MLSPVAVCVVNRDKIEIDEIKVANTFAALYPEFFGKEFDEVPPNYLAFEVPKTALRLGLVSKVIPLYVSSPVPIRIPFEKIADRKLLMR